MKVDYSKMVFLDIETMMIKEDGIAKLRQFPIQIGILRFNQTGKCIEKKEWFTLLPKGCKVIDSYAHMHKNMFADWTNNGRKYSVYDVTKKLQKYIDDGLYIVGHNVKSFDLTWLNVYGLDISNVKVFDTLNFIKYKYARNQKAYGYKWSSEKYSCEHLFNKLIFGDENIKFTLGASEIHEVNPDNLMCKIIVREMAKRKGFMTLFAETFPNLIRL